MNEVATDFFPGAPGLLEVRNGRYLSFSGCPAHACEDRALVWTDLESKIVVFVATGDEAQNFARETRIQYPIQSAKLFLATKADLLPAKLPDELSTSVLRWLHLEGVLRLDGVTLTTPTGIEPVTTDQIQWTGRFGKPDIF